MLSVGKRKTHSSTKGGKCRTFWCRLRKGLEKAGPDGNNFCKNKTRKAVAPKKSTGRFATSRSVMGTAKRFWLLRGACATCIRVPASPRLHKMREHPRLSQAINKIADFVAKLLECLLLSAGMLSPEAEPPN